MTGRLIVTGNELVISTPFYQANLVAAIKALPERQWDGKVWRLPVSHRNWNALQPLISTFHLDVEPNVSEIVQRLTSILIGCRTCQAQWWWSPFGDLFWWEKSKGEAWPCLPAGHKVALMQ